MTPEKTKKAFYTLAMIIHDHGKSLILTRPLKATRNDEQDIFSHDTVVGLEHLLYMCVEGIKLVEQGRMEKAMRWLGFIQGDLHVRLRIPISALKDINRPEDPT